MLHEVMHELRKKKMKSVIFKVDCEKAYDSIHWGFVENVLMKKGFDEEIRGWIMSTVKGGGGCVLTSTGRMGHISGPTWV